MNKYYFSFGQDHEHKFNGVKLDRDVLLEIEAENSINARKIMFEAFNRKWSNQFNEDALVEILDFFPRGIIKLKDIITA